MIKHNTLANHHDFSSYINLLVLQRQDLVFIREQLKPEVWQDCFLCNGTSSHFNSRCSCLLLRGKMRVQLQRFWTLAHTAISEYRLAESSDLHHLAPRGLGVTIQKICGLCLEMRQSCSPTFPWQELSGLATSKSSRGFRLWPRKCSERMRKWSNSGHPVLVHR